MPTCESPIDRAVAEGNPRATEMLSVIIPALNEIDRLPRFLETVARHFREAGKGPYEIIVVDDGSSDGTSEMLKELGADWPQLRCLQHSVNRGKGAALRTGLLAADGACLLFADADGACPIGEVQALRRAIESGADIAVGSRRVAAPDVKRTRSLGRGLAGRLFSLVAQGLLKPPVRDTQCGFKLVRRSAALRLINLCQENGYLFDLEFLLLARRMNLKIVEVGVSWHDVAGSKVRLVRDATAMALGVWRIRRRLSGIPLELKSSSLDGRTATED
jgi:dolichyl-phosphate beta-glucosyltransferase